MTSSVFVFDPTVGDVQSKVRGVGRYLQILREKFSSEWTFVSDLTSIPHDSTFINPFFNLLSPAISHKRLAKRQIAVIHDLIPLKYPEHFPIGLRGKLNAYLNKRALKNYDHIVTDSEASKKDIVDMLHIDEKHISVIYPVLPKIFIDNQNTKTVIDESLPSKYCLYVGDATWNKNLVTLARAIKEINVTCVFVGKVFEILRGEIKNLSESQLSEQAMSERVDLEENFLSRQLTHPWQQELKNFLIETKDDKRFIFKGFVPDEKLIQLYKQSRVNILSSRDEGFGFSYLEAASQGTPSVLSDIPVFREISGGKGALFVQPNDVSSLANTIGELYFRNGKRDESAIEAFQQSKKFINHSFKTNWKLAIS